MAVENAVAQIPPVHNIGALLLETRALRGSLKAAAATWKAQFANKLHSQGTHQLKVGSSLAAVPRTYCAVQC